MFTFDDIIDSFTRRHPKQSVIKDDFKSLDYESLSRIGNNLAYLLKKKNVKKKNRIAFLSYNRIEFAEVLYASSKLGAIITPINFRLSKEEILDILKDSNPKFLIYEKCFSNIIRFLLKNKYFSSKKVICIDNKYYKNLINKKYRINNKNLKNSNKDDYFSLMYTSGTTGKPKGVVRDHNSYYNLAAITSIELSIKKTDSALLVMPLCHANSFNFFYSYIFAGASIYVYSKKSFESKSFFNIIKKYKCSFTSLVPTHFIILLEYLKKSNKKNVIRHKFNFMISSAPAREDTKKEILYFFKSANLYELYGSSESGWVTMLHPEEQFSNLGTVGRECVGSKNIKILNDKYNEVDDGIIGELYASTPYNFSHYWKNKSKTQEAYYKDYVTVGDLAYRNKVGFIVLVDRKKNMIISGGENIYPSEVENIIGQHVCVKDVAIIGYEDKKWGEIVCAFVVLNEKKVITELNLIKWTKNRLAGYKCPKKVFFINNDDMPRNTTGKVLHKELKNKVTIHMINKND